MFNKNFITKIIDRDNLCKIVVRFPPDPNGHLHIGHLKNALFNRFLADKYKGLYYLRFDDSNPLTAKKKYYDSILEDLSYMNIEFDNIFYSSSYFDVAYNYARQLIINNKAYACSMNIDDHKARQGNLYAPGSDSPYRNRSVAENLHILDLMLKGNSCSVIKIKMNMSAANFHMRDPIILRVKNCKHVRLDESYCVYPSYDFIHPISDYIENITHSICTLEFEEHRPLYNWIINNINENKKFKPKQIEFARLNITGAITSKTKINEMIKKGIASSPADPRFLTIKGMKNRGYTVKGIKDFIYCLSISKSNCEIDIKLLEKYIRADLSDSPRRHMVIDPIYVNLIKDPAGPIYANNHPFKDLGNRALSISSKILINRSDFSLDQSFEKKLSICQKVRLLDTKYVLQFNSVIKDDLGHIKGINCDLLFDQDCKNAITWVDQSSCVTYETTYIRSYNLFKKQVFLESCMRFSRVIGQRFQMMRFGYYYITGHRQMIEIVGLKSKVERNK